MTSAPKNSDFLAMFSRRKKSFLIPFALLFGISIALATMLPSVYQSSATVQIENQEVPGNLLESTVVTGYIDEHLDTLGRRVMTTENLWQIAERLDLYPEIRDENAKHEVASVIRENASRNILYVEIGPEEQRRPEDSVAVAFNTTYTAGDPDTASEVANALAELYVEESRRVRSDRAAELADFLRAQTDLLARRVDEYEQELSDFKEQHGRSLPEYAEHNMRARETAQEQLDRVNERINSLNQQKIGLQAQLAQIDPEQRVNLGEAELQTLSAPQQVERLRQDYLRLSGMYSPRHPDLRRLRRTLEALQGEAQQASRILELVTEVEESRTELAEARERYSDDHPDVIRLQRTIGENKEELREIGQGEGAVTMTNNPAYITANAQLRAVEADLEAEAEQRERLTQRLQELDTRLTGSPDIEKEYRALTRKHDNAVNEYQETRDKLLRAEASERMEEFQLGGSQFKLASPATRPSEPAQPQRAGIAVLGFILAAGLGTGLAAVAEYLDSTVRGARSVMALWGAPPIAAIPTIETKSERRRRVVRLVVGWLMLLAIVAGLVVGGIIYAPNMG